MLDDLVAVINTLKARMADYRESLQGNETRTRTALIDPLLRALGWDVSDPALVTPEYNLSGQKADYALFNDGGEPVAVLEAKRLGTSFSTPEIAQMVTYANLSNVHYAGLTDGNRWELYKVLQPGPLEEKRLLNVSIAEMPTHESALQLLMLWRPNLRSGQPSRANEPILGVAEVLPPALPSPTPPVAPPVDAGWTPIMSLPKDVNWQNQPSRVRFPTGEERPVQPTKWKSVLIEVAEWLIRAGLLAGHDCPVGRVSARHIVHTEALHPDGSSFFYPAGLSNGLSLASAANAKNAAADCIALMTHFAQDPSRLYVRIS